jgi:O-antigen ligase
MLRESWACGIGAGEMNFRSVYINFATAGIEDVPHAHSLYLQILIQVGVVGLVFLIGAVLLAAQKVYSHRFDALADDETRLIAIGCFAGIVAILVFGLSDYVWYNYRIMFVFWAFLGLASAAVNVGREDIRLSEAAIPCHGATSSDSAELTINFRKGES